MFTNDDDLIEDRPRRPWGKWMLWGAIVAVLVAGLGYVVRQVSSPHRNHPAASLLIAGQQASEEERFDEALALFQRAEAQGELPADILFSCAEAAMHQGDAILAEQYLRRLLTKDPQHVGGNEMLCAMLRVAGRNWELRPYSLALMRKDYFTAGNLAAVALDDFTVEYGTPDETQLERFIVQHAAAKNQPLAKLSQARYLLSHNRDPEALPFLKDVVAEDPQQLDAQARLGALLLKNNDTHDFSEWQRQLPTNAFTHPEIWMVGGLWAEQHGNLPAAARSYWETLRLHPDHPGATHRLSQVLLALDRKSEAAIFAARAKQLAESKMLVSEMRSHPERLQRLAELMESIGRKWEALGWCQVALERKGENDLGWAQQQADRLRPALQDTTNLAPDKANIAMSVDLSTLPKPDWKNAPATEDAPEKGLTVASHIAFVDSARSAGIDFTFFNGADPERAYMFEFSGGGVAVLDYDADGWPDIYLTQGCSWPVRPDQQRYTDRLYRNLGDGRFADVTEQVGLRDSGYGQGATVGDLDNDGLPDLYVANIGGNRFYHNNGDGTFTDVTEELGITGTEWTISALIADLNGDTWPEIYDVNYLGGPQVFTDVCGEPGQRIQCYPSQFPAEFHKLYQNLGNGTLRDVSEAAGIRLPDGKGMGIVAADFDNSRRLSLFISNDTTANFFFLNQTPTLAGALSFSEQALVSGVALSETGKAASCMGIAAGDSNGDNLLDLFVTNFQDEANNLYVQVGDLLFADQIRRSRLHDPGFQMEGWGAQFLDADLDGKQDLVVANGHLDDYPHSLGVNRMPTQFFYNGGDGRFAEVPAKQLGPYFETPYLGRALARLDWNRDGLPDFCVTHVDTPFALLTNRSTAAGRSLVVHLRAVRSARDAIGATVTVRAADQLWSQQLMAGDGFAASNQRQLTFGLQSTPQVDELTIQWPSGLVQTYHNLPTNNELLFVEARAVPHRLSP